MHVSVTVKPNSKKGPLVEETDAGLIVYVREPAAEGRASRATTKLIAGYYGVAKTQVTILRGATSRIKLINIDLG